ncbi:hypothetical protein DAPPUDRAFT_325594 [Daphnia pulex]|uniref:Uncharacterized protein n=1 Tax=Daphnia pulex TaxID=6669 RepID=E9H577_DAPPU|nr:hypothetical protein DAPPUDRAFT_325594 [Daphnia pulex]|eukprot:EFX73081.1 hypothetical protein DAPPUDRAFT_325594 [Daphnia pulex]
MDVSRVTQISHEFQQVWDLDQRVKALKTNSGIYLLNVALYFCLKLTPLPFIRANLSQLPIFLIILVKWLLKEIDADKVIRLVGLGNTMHLQLVSPGIGSEEMSGKPLRARSTPLKEWIGLDQARRWPIIYGMPFPRLGASLTP